VAVDIKRDQSGMDLIGIGLKEMLVQELLLLTLDMDIVELPIQAGFVEVYLLILVKQLIEKPALVLVLIVVPVH